MPSIRASAAQAMSGTTQVPTMPSVVAGDLIIAQAQLSVGAQMTIAGYLKKAEASGPRLYVFGRVATGDANDNITGILDTNNGVAWTILSVQDWPGTLDDFTVLTAASNDPPLLTPAWGSAANLWLEGVGGSGGTLPAVSVWSTDYTEVAQITGNFGTDVFGGIAQRTFTAVSQDPGAVTITGSPTNVRSATMAVRPSGSAPSGGSTADVEVDAEGDGSKTVAGGSEANVEVDAEGGGSTSGAGGSEADVEVDAEAGGAKTGIGGSTANVDVDAEGGGGSTGRMV